MNGVVLLLPSQDFTAIAGTATQIYCAVNLLASMYRRIGNKECCEIYRTKCMQLSYKFCLMKKKKIPVCSPV